MRTERRQTEGGVLLVEVLIALALFLAISTIIAQALSVSFVSEKASRTRATGTGVLEELLTQVRAASEVHWDTIAGLQRNAPYVMSISGGLLVVATGTQSVMLDGTSYTRSFVVRDAVRSIASTLTPLALTATSSTRSDAGSLIIDGKVTWGKGESVLLESVITRWRNIVCGQTSWTAAGSTTLNCESASIPIGSKSNIELGDKLLLCSGC